MRDLIKPVGRTMLPCALKLRVRQDRSERYDRQPMRPAGRDDDRGTRIVGIQDPAGKARTFTFGRGWLDVAVVESE